jgi:pyruvate formate lyase activating enzyme
MAGSISLKSFLDEHSMPAAPELVRPEGKGVVRCLACGHRCVIQRDKSGICRVRVNRGGQLRVPAGYVAGLNVDPIEKKPFYHVLPGQTALSYGMLGCNFHCSFCQNWISSQALRDEHAVTVPTLCDADRLISLALEHGATMVTSTYNEPLITTEWSVEIFRLAKEHGLLCGYVSNGHATPELMEFLRPHMDLFNIDLKCFAKEKYRELGGAMENVLETISGAHRMGFWVEVVTLVVPGFNDSDEELAMVAKFLASVDVNIPWHCTAFHPDYKMTGPPRTPVSTLLRAYEIGRDAGLKFVYAGNLPGQVGNTENTYCPGCGELLVERIGFSVGQNRMSDGRCPKCNESIAGVWKQ